MKKTKINNILPLIIILLLIIAITHMPYGYYTFLRIIVAGYSGYLTYNYFVDEKNVPGGIFATIGILYNPIIIIHLNREIWSVIDIIVIMIFIVFIIMSVIEKRSKKRQYNVYDSRHIDKVFETDPKYYKELERRMKLREKKAENNKSSGKKRKTVKCATPAIEREKTKVYNDLNKEEKLQIPFGTIPGSLLTKGDKEYKDNVRKDNIQIKNIKKEIKENYLSMMKCNKFGIKKEVIQKAVLQKKIRTRLLNGKQYYHKEDIVNLL